MNKNSSKTNPQFTRLPDNVKPEHYWLSFSPNFDKLSFSGQEIVTIEVLKATNQVVLHSKDLAIDYAVIENETSEQVCKVKYDKTNDLLLLSVKNELKAGTYNLEIGFNGKLNKNMRGFYHSQYELHGKTQNIAVTQFEPTDARKAFPCFDEPDLKATFSLEVLTPSGMEAISNTVIVSKIRQKNGLYKVVFAPSPVMSTYLLAIVVGKFEFIEDLSEDGVTVRVFTTPGKKAQAEFALETAKGVLDFFNSYFKIKYPLPTLDMIAIPDFAAGAMENWGAVTYRETAILVDPKNTSTLAKQWVALVIAHELAHQWFGNLVTMKWWTHLWLNEGFASYISYLAVDHLFPKWNMWSQFMNADLNPALELDSLRNTHPIQVEVNHPNEINEIFDEVSYAKGASVLRMLADYLGPVRFRDGLRYYLKKHQYSNASTDDLWKALEKISGKPVRKIMSGWTEQPGYPLILASIKGKKLILEQKRFLAEPKQKTGNRQSWSIPVVINSGGKISRLVLNKKKHSLNLPKGSYLKLNSGEVGLYRTKYDQHLFEQLLPVIENQKLSTADRLGLLRDQLALARAGSNSSDKVLELLSAYKNEKKYTVWVQIGTALGQISHLYKYDNKINSLLNKFSEAIFKPIAQDVGWEPQTGEEASRSLLRTFALYRAGHYGNKEVIAKAQELFYGYYRKNKAIDADLRAVVYNLVAENGSTKEYEALYNKYKAESLLEEKNRLARAMALVPNEQSLNRYLKFCLSKEVRQQDAPLLIGAAWANRISKDLVWKFISKNWKEILNKYGDGGHLLVRFIEPVSNFSQIQNAQQIRTFFKKNKAPGAERTIEQALEEITIQAAWYKRDRKKVEKFLKNMSN